MLVDTRADGGKFVCPQCGLPRRVRLLLSYTSCALLVASLSEEASQDFGRRFSSESEEFKVGARGTFFLRSRNSEAQSPDEKGRKIINEICGKLNERHFK